MFKDLVEMSAAHPSHMKILLGLPCSLNPGPKTALNPVASYHEPYFNFELPALDQR